MSRLVYYLLILPVSFMPFPILYILSDCLYLVLYHVIGYRKKVVRENLELVFPDKSLAERKQLVRKFYRHLADLIMESIKAFTISDEKIRKRFKITGVNNTFIDHHNNRDIIVVCGHNANWEWASLACPLVFRHQCAVIITPVSDAFINRKISASRSRNGYHLIPKDAFNRYVSQDQDRPLALFFLSDQSPSDADRAYWTNFLGVNTPVQFGIEKYAKKLNCPVYYIDVKRVGRGYYDASVSLLISNPNNMAYGTIVEKITERISETILSRPSDWLWSHRRWKHKKRDHDS